MKKQKHKCSDEDFYEQKLEDLVGSVFNTKVRDLQFIDRLNACVKASEKALSKKPSITSVELACVTEDTWVTILHTMGDLVYEEDVNEFLDRLVPCCLIDRRLEKAIKRLTNCFTPEDVNRMSERNAMILRCYLDVLREAKKRRCLGS